MSYFEPVKSKVKPTMYIIHGPKGGVVPEELKGEYTKRHYAIEAINRYEGQRANSTSTPKRRSGKASTTSKKASSGDRQTAAQI